MFLKTVLENNLRIITAPMHGTNTVTILVMCDTGADNETPKEAGISHFLEHMLFKGTKRRPTPQHIKNELDSMGSISNAFTGHEMTGYFIKVGHVYFERALDLMADIYSNSLLDPKEIGRERQVILEEVHMIHDTPERFIGHVYEELLYGGQPAGRDVLGTEENIKTFTAGQFRSYFTRQYTAENTVVIVAGKFNESSLTKKIGRLFGGSPVAGSRPKAAFRESQKNPAVKLHYKKTDQSHLIIGFRAYDAHYQERYAADMLATILGGNWSSRMWDVIRDRLGLAYHVQTWNDTYSNRGYLATYMGVAHKNIEKAISAAVGEFRKIVASPVSEKELMRAKDYVKGTSLIALESSSSVANFVGIEEVVTRKPLTIQEVFAKIDRVTSRDVQAVARKVIKPAGFNLAVVGPFRDSTKFTKLLRM